jgi:hypothetical protein
MVDKDRFTSQLEYEIAGRAAVYQGQKPVSEKMAGACLRDTVADVGVSSNLGAGVCPLAPECMFRNDKNMGLGGECLKAVVGVREGLPITYNEDLK